MNKYFSNRFSYYLFDWANSPFSTVIITFIFSSYFVNSIASDKISGTSMWGWTIALSGLFISFLGPFLGYLGDKKKKLCESFFIISNDNYFYSLQFVMVFFSYWPVYIVYFIYYFFL